MVWKSKLQFKRTAYWEECSPEEKVMKKNFVVRVIEQLQYKRKL